ncbi:Mu transposase C-terminal domain-containing protein [Geobacillus sp. LEMMY01]|uniref:Mu transposase C-terminal domain-containing protein n=1 Tax=Geobacillus sp. LEMMY01 TaxID=1954237 RepID=UPI0009ACCEB1|nr:Mu transposase C-terminal domain-containing protein [Geobacillus sp. LEMMY01]
MSNFCSPPGHENDSSGRMHFHGKVLNTPPYRADWKGIVEQSFRKANLKTIHWLPGAVKERYRERGEKDHRLDATLDLHQFTKIMINTFLNHNLYHRMHWYSRDEFMIQDHVEPIPNELWRWGIENRVGHLREKPSDIIQLNLMPRDEATVTESGIRFKGMFYSCERALNEQWFEKARVYGNFKVPVAYDTRNKADTINLILNNGKDFEVCYLLERESRYKGRRLEEVLDLHEFEKLDEAKYQTTKIQSDAELNAQNNAIIEEAKQQTMQALRLSNISNNRRITNIRTNRKEEKERVREKEKWNLGKVTPFIPKTNEVEQTTTGEFELTPKLTKQQSFLKMLKSQTKGKG